LVVNRALRQGLRMRAGQSVGDGQSRAERITQKCWMLIKDRGRVWDVWDGVWSVQGCGSLFSVACRWARYWWWSGLDRHVIEQQRPRRCRRQESSAFEDLASRYSKSPSVLSRGHVRPGGRQLHARTRGTAWCNYSTQCWSHVKLGASCTLE
jgi:hypothetical protein